MTKREKYGFPDVDQLVKDMKDPEKMAERKRKKEVEEMADEEMKDTGY